MNFMKQACVPVVGSLLAVGGCDGSDNHTGIVAEQSLHPYCADTYVGTPKITDDIYTGHILKTEVFDTLSYEPAYVAAPLFLEFYLCKLLDGDDREVTMIDDPMFGPYWHIIDDYGNVLCIHPFMDVGRDTQTYISKLIYLPPSIHLEVDDLEVGEQDMFSEEVLLEHTRTGDILPYDLLPERDQITAFLRSCVRGVAIEYPSILPQDTTHKHE